MMFLLSSLAVGVCSSLEIRVLVFCGSRWRLKASRGEPFGLVLSASDRVNDDNQAITCPSRERINRAFTTFCSEYRRFGSSSRIPWRSRVSRV